VPTVSIKSKAVTVARRFAGREIDLPLPTRLAATHEIWLSKAIQDAWDLSVGAVDLRVLSQALGQATTDEAVESAVLALRLDYAKRKTVEAVRPLLIRAFLVGVEIGASPLRALGITIERSVKQLRFEIDLSAVNAEAVDWADKHAASLVVAPADVRSAIRDLVVISQRGDLTPIQLARQIREFVGLDIRRANAVARFAERLSLEGVFSDELTRRVARYAWAQRRSRAMTIARTEAISALGAGQQEIWSQAVSQGALSPQTMGKTWITTPDDLLCKTCEGLDGVVVGIDEEFPIGKSQPPAHPNCRCATGLVPTKE
jgi:SPP1 gp7 family putative phage head morphogenesis protein